MKSESAILTIAIPTYHRAAKLQSQLERLVPQLTPEVRLAVFDNASPDETRDVVAKYLSRGVAYHRAATNCGAGRNVFRCFEECQTEWIWILGDDDPVSETAVNDLLKTLRQPAFDFIHFSTCECSYAQNQIVTDVGSMLHHTTFSSLLWISAGVYRVPAFAPLFGLYNQSLSTWGPHLIMVLSLLESRGGRVLLSTTELLVRPEPAACSWSTLDCILRVSQAPEYLQHPANQKLLATCILLQWYNGSLLMGLREASPAGRIPRWRRIRRQAFWNLKAYHACGNVHFFLGNWFRAGQRKRSLSMLLNSFMVTLLGWCPSFLFPKLIRRLPLLEVVKKEYAKAEGFTPSR